MRDRVRNPATSSQEWKKDNPCRGSPRELGRSDVCERSGSSGKPVRGVENQVERTRLDLHSVQISDNRYTEKVFEIIRQSWSLSSSELDEKTNA